MKIGIFGGTFDPVHIGHLRAAEEFAEALELERVLMVPSSVPPHRPAPVASPAERLEMMRLALAGSKRLEVSDMELRREGPSYTVDTLEDLRLEYDAEIPALALGADAYSEIASWHRPQDVLARAQIVVLTRPRAAVDLIAPLPKELRRLYRLDGGLMVHPGGGTLRSLPITLLDISSSRIRSLIAAGRSFRYLVPEKVHEYIQDNRLYAARRQDTNV